MSDVGCTYCGKLIERWGKRWRHVRREGAATPHQAMPAREAEEEQR